MSIAVTSTKPTMAFGEDDGQLRIRLGSRMRYELPQPTPMTLRLNVHYSRVSDLEWPDYLLTTPAVPVDGFRDEFGNWCVRLVAAAGRFEFSTDAIIHDSGDADAVLFDAEECPIQDLPPEPLSFLTGSRYCETDRLMETAWGLFATAQPGWARVQAITDFAHHTIAFGYEHADPTRTALEVLTARKGVCRDFAHLAITLCRCMNIPARYCTGYLSDVGEPPPHPPMDFAAWMEVYLSGRWWVFDPRNNARRVGRILIARGRDAADVPIAHTFGPNRLVGFEVWTEAVE